jgi:arsenate reductase
MLKVLLLRTSNSCRRQMAEGSARHLKEELLEPYSTGMETPGRNPNDVKVMAEVGVDISQHRSKNLSELADISFDHVVTVCGNAHETCPVFPGTTRVTHEGFGDPPHLAKQAATQDEAWGHYRRVRDELRENAETLPGV